MPFWQENEEPAQDWGEKLKGMLQRMPKDSEEWQSDV